MNRNYKTQCKLDVPESVFKTWRETRNADAPVTLAIHAISNGTRSPDEIWQDPTQAECENVEMAVSEYISHGDFEAQIEYRWGDYRFTLDNDSAI